MNIQIAYAFARAFGRIPNVSRDGITSRSSNISMLTWLALRPATSLPPPPSLPYTKCTSALVPSNILHFDSLHVDHPQNPKT